MGWPDWDNTTPRPGNTCGTDIFFNFSIAAASKFFVGPTAMHLHDKGFDVCAKINRSTTTFAKRLALALCSPGL
jgi:hypothetical protein